MAISATPPESTVNPAPDSAPATTPATTPTVLVGQTLAELTAWVKTLDEPAFRAKQLYHWLYVRNARTFDAMTNLSRAFRDKLAAVAQISCLTIADKQISRDGTTKYLLRLPDGRVVESVLMQMQVKERDTLSLCMSSQVGCAVNCSFCATGKLGFTRDLSVAEIVDQYMLVQADSGREIRNIVFMGQGEPLLNTQSLLPALRLLNEGAEVGMRRITVSTSGIVPEIERLSEEKLQLILAVSLHAADNETRSRLMPLNRKWPLEKLMPALHAYVAKTGRRMTIEYVLLAGENDSPEDAHRLGVLLKSLKCNVNLIPYNPIDCGNDPFQRPSSAVIRRFTQTLEPYGKKVTVRVERGVDIDAACGQLANRHAAANSV